MPLTVQSFKEVAFASQTHKERFGSDFDGETSSSSLLSDTELLELRKDFGCLDEELFEQVVTVRNRHLEHVPHMLRALVNFRSEQGWKNRISSSELNPSVVAHGAHTVVTNPQMDLSILESPSSDEDSICVSPKLEHLPMIRIAYGKIDPAVASAKDFQQECQYAIREASRLHPCGEIAVACDFRGASFGVLTQLNGDDLSRGIEIYKTYPVKVKQVYIVNATLPVRMVIKAVLALSSKSIRRKVRFVKEKELLQ